MWERFRTKLDSLEIEKLLDPLGRPLSRSVVITICYIANVVRPSFFLYDLMYCTSQFSKSSDEDTICRPVGFLSGSLMTPVKYTL